VAAFGRLDSARFRQDPWAVAPKIRKIVLIQGHPDADRPHLAHALADAYAAGAREAGHLVSPVAVATLSFPFVRSRDDLERREPPPAIRTIQQLIIEADHIVQACRRPGNQISVGVAQPVLT
jgi:hypothetical protein